MADIPLTAAQNGGHVRASVGDVLVIRLTENPTTGFRWQIDDVGGLVVQADDYAAYSSAIGAAGERTVRLAVVRAGVTEIRLSLRRGWEASAPRLSFFAISVDVQ